MQRDIFRRGVRMSHAFGSLEKVRDPLDSATFKDNFPERLDQLRSAPLEVQSHGEYRYRMASSPIVKPAGGHASMQGRTPDVAQDIAMPMPVGTKRRLGPLRTDK